MGPPEIGVVTAGPPEIGVVTAALGSAFWQRANLGRRDWGAVLVLHLRRSLSSQLLNVSLDPSPDQFSESPPRSSIAPFTMVAGANALCSEMKLQFPGDVMHMEHGAKAVDTHSGRWLAWSIWAHTSSWRSHNQPSTT